MIWLLDGFHQTITREATMEYLNARCRRQSMIHELETGEITGV